MWVWCAVKSRKRCSGENRYLFFTRNGIASISEMWRQVQLRKSRGSGTWGWWSPATYRQTTWPLWPLTVPAYKSQLLTGASHLAERWKDSKPETGQTLLTLIKAFSSEWSKSRSVVFDSLRPRGLYSLWNSLGRNTGVGSLSLLQGGSSQSRDRTPVSLIAGGFFTSWATREAQSFLWWWPFPMPLGHGAVYQLGMQTLVPGKLENTDLPQAQDAKLFVQDEQDIPWVGISLTSILNSQNFPR